MLRIKGGSDLSVILLMITGVFTKKTKTLKQFPFLILTMR